MSGTRLSAEGLPGFRVSTLRAADSSVENSLEGAFDVGTLQSGATGYVEDIDAEYRWLADSLVAPSNPTVVIPLGQSTSVPGRWIQIAGDHPATETEFDYILTSRADLVNVVAPISDVFTLPAGSYFIKASFSLNAEEQLLVADATVRISGGGYGKVLTGSGSGGLPVVDVQNGGVCNLDNFALAVSGDAEGISVTGTGILNVDRVEVQAVGTALHCVGGVTRSSESFYRSTGGDTVVVDAARFYTDGDHVASLLEDPGSTGSLLLTSEDSYVLGTGSEFEAEEGNPSYVIAATAGALLQLTGGSVIGHNTGPLLAHGVIVRGDIPRVNLDGVFFEELDTCLIWESGILFSAAFQNCVTIACVRGVDWDSINVPSQGLVETGNTFNMISANAFLNHVATDANVMRRSNSASAGLLDETPIIPASSGITEFDYILSSRADLVAVVAPVADVFNLPGGSYFIKSTFALNADERIVILENTRISGGGQGVRLQGNSATGAFIDVQDGGIDLDNFVLFVEGGMDCLLKQGGRMRLTDMSMLSEGGGVSSLSGDTYVVDCIVSSVTAAISVTNGSCKVTDSQLQCSDDDVVVLAAGGTGQLYMNQTAALHSSSDGATYAVAARSETSDCFLKNCDLATSSSFSGLFGVLGANIVNIAGGKMRKDGVSVTGNRGVVVDGNVSALIVKEVAHQILATSLTWVSGVAGSVIYDSNYIEATCDFGLNWSSTDLPTVGLTISNNLFDIAAAVAILNHVETDAGVFWRANRGNDAALADTPIVP